MKLAYILMYIQQQRLKLFQSWLLSILILNSPLLFSPICLLSCNGGLQMQTIKSDKSNVFFFSTVQ